jgi:hypothetical protein
MKNLLLAAFVCCAICVAFAEDDPATVLARILVEKGTLSSSELMRIESASSAGRVAALASILSEKGLLNDSDLARLAQVSGTRPSAEPVRAVLASATSQSPAPPKAAPESAPPVTAQSRLPLTLYGTLLFNAFYNTALTNIEDIPLLAGKQGSDPFGNDKNFGMTARQSRLGMRFQGPLIGDARLSGQVEVDFLGGKAAFGNGINMDLVRLRLALGRLDWKHFSLVAGQDWSIFAPLNPTTLAEFAIPGLSASGNPWIRTPQVRAEYHNDLSDKTKIQFQLAAVDPDMGDYNTAIFSSSRTPGIGERGRFPGIESRLGITTRASERDFSFGVSSHYARGKNVGTIGSNVIQTGVDSWGVALDYSLPLTKALVFTGEWYEGRALGIFSVSTGQAILPVGTAGEHGVESRGGWSQLQFNVNPKWQFNLDYGIDADLNRNLRTGDRNKNQTYMGNVIYKYSPNVNLSVEWRRFLTNWKNQQFANEIGDHFNLGIAYIF